jgi:hypothetical protein
MKISEIITPVNCKYGAPMGRPNIGTEPITVTRGRNGRICKCDQVKVYQKRVHLIDGYDQGGAYWGIGKPLYVRFTKDLLFVQYFRANWE